MSDLVYSKTSVKNEYNCIVLQFTPMLKYTIKYNEGQPIATVFKTNLQEDDLKPELKTKIPAVITHIVVFGNTTSSTISLACCT